MNMDDAKHHFEGLVYGICGVAGLVVVIVAIMDLVLDRPMEVERVLLSLLIVNIGVLVFIARWVLIGARLNEETARGVSFLVDLKRGKSWPEIVDKYRISGYHMSREDLIDY
jgi:hypothetical protein